MNLAQMPARTSIVWAKNTLGTYIRIPPLAKSSGGAASFSEGFPPANFTPVAAGGVPPFGQDMNGLLQQMTAWDQWYQAGGTIRYDPTFQNQGGIVGYPKSARVESRVTAGLIWQSTIDANMSDPEDPILANRRGWQQPVFPDPTYNGISAQSFIGALKVDGSLNTTYGANIALYGNTKLVTDGSNITGPNKYIRVLNGIFQVMNNGYGAPILTLNETGDLGAINDITASGNITTTTGTVTAGAAVITNNASVGGDFFLAGGQWVFHDEVNTTPNPSAPNALDLYTYLASAKSNYWYDKWNGHSGNREWHGPIYNGLNPPNNTTGDYTAMVLRIGDPPSIVAGDIYLAVWADLQLGMGSESPQWRFQQRINPQEGSNPKTVHDKYTFYEATETAGYWYEKWNGNTGDREWHAPAFTLAGTANPTADYVAMQLHVGYQWNITQGDIYLSVAGDLKLGQYNNWIFHQEVITGLPVTPTNPNGNAYSKYVQYNGGGPDFGYWYDYWNGTNGDREWHGPFFDTAAPANPTSGFVAMKLHIGDQPNLALNDIYLQVHGQIRTDTLSVTGASSQSGTFPHPATTSTNTNGIGDSFGIATSGFLHAGNNFSPNSYNNAEWNFAVDGSGNKIQCYSVINGGTSSQADDAYDIWNKTDYSRAWAGALGGPGGAVVGLMGLDANGNLTVRGAVHGSNVTTMEQAIERITTRLNALDGGGDVEHAPA